MTMSTSSWPPKSGLSTPTVHRKDAILPISGSINISAPAAVVWAVLLDTTEWSTWNSFVPRVTFQSQPSGVAPDSKSIHLGTLMTFDVVMDPAKPNKTSPTSLRVVDISTPEQPTDYVSNELLEEDESSFTKDLTSLYRISWKPEGGYASRGLKSERFHELIITGEDSCEVRTWEVFGGILARTIKWMFTKTLQDRFADWCRDLKQQSEKIYNESKA